MGMSKARNPKPPEPIDITMVADLACTNTALRRAARRLGQLYDDAMGPAGLKATQAAMLSKIEEFSANTPNEGPTLQMLAERLGIQISALTHAMKPLLRDGLIKVRQDDEDKRTKHAILTASGKARLKEALRLWAGVNNRVEAVLGPGSAQTLRALADSVSSDAFLKSYKANKRLG
jgi:DNA-binding MarR family transcriptional regulator